MSLEPNTPNYSTSIEISGNDTEELREFIERTGLSDREDITNIEIRIEAENPFYAGTVEEPDEANQSAATSTRGPDAEDRSDSHPTDELTAETSPPEPEQSNDPIPEIEIDYRPNQGTKNFKIAAVLHRSNPLRLREVTDTLAKTAWETKYKTISAVLSRLRSENMAKKTNGHGGKWSLTDEGTAVMREIEREADTYPYSMADKITGRHPYHGPDDVKAEA